MARKTVSSSSKLLTIFLTLFFGLLALYLSITALMKANDFRSRAALEAISVVGIVKNGTPFGIPHYVLVDSVHTSNVLYQLLPVEGLEMEQLVQHADSTVSVRGFVVPPYSTKRPSDIPSLKTPLLLVQSVNAN